MKALCQNSHTAAWIIHTLLSILHRTAILQDNNEGSQSKAKRNSFAKATSNSTELLSHLQSHNLKNKSRNLWLSMSVDAALGCKANVFTIQKTQPESGQGRSHKSRVSIHPLAAPMVCRRIVDLLVFLARNYNQHFIPSRTPETKEIKEKISKVSESPLETDFWDYLVKLEQTSLLHRGKTVSKVAETDVNTLRHSLLEGCPLGQILHMLNHPVIKQCTNLTDRIIKLLFVIASNMPSNLALPELDIGLKSDDKAVAIESKTPQDPPKGEEANKEKPGNRRPLMATDEKILSGTVVAKTSLSDAMVERLRLFVNVMCTGRCSEDGLEDATNFLIHLSRSLTYMRRCMLNLLLHGARSLGRQLRKDICCLLDEMRESSSNKSRKRTPEETEDTRSNKPSTAEGVRSSLSLGNVRTGYENTAITNRSRRLVEQHFKAMAPLTCKTSSQSLFLRILKVILQLRSQSDINRSPENSQQVSNTLEVAGLEPTASTSSEKDAPRSPSIIGDSMSFRLSQQIDLNDLWDVLGECLSELGEDSDSHAVLILQPAVEAFFIVHSPDKDYNADKESLHVDSPISQKQLLNQLTKFAPITPTPSTSESFFSLPPDTAKFVQFAEKHRTVLNQILRQSPTPLLEGPFSILVNHTRLLDFDVKRKYFRQQLDKLNDTIRPEDGFTIRVRRTHVFEDSFKELSRRTADQMKSKMFIHFEGEDGQDAGGLLREWYLIISREIFNPNYALFITSSGDRVTYIINSSSHVNHYHLEYFKFVGRMIAKALFDNKLLDVYFSRSMYKHILGSTVHYSDIEAEDYTFYQSMKYLLEHNISEIDNELTFSTDVCEFGKSEIRDLKPNGRSIAVTEANKLEYVHLMCQMKMTGAVRKQIASFLEGFYEIIPKRLISIFDPQELELLISGLPTIDIDDLKANTDYSKYTKDSIQVGNYVHTIYILYGVT